MHDDRCPNCDRVIATADNADEGMCEVELSYNSRRRSSDWNLRARRACDDHAVDWRTRALAAEAALVELPVALGVGEECGELAEAKTHAEATDAVGDVAIYVCQVATRERLAMSEILAEAGRIADRALATNRGLTHQWRTLMARVGRVAHLALKRHQKIREGALPDAEYRALLADALAELLAAVELAAGVSVAECFADTAPTVLARDWSADRAGGGR